MLDLTQPLHQQAQQLIREQCGALQQLAHQIDAQFEQAIALLLAVRGRVVISGMGKSGIIGQKIAATLASTGTPALFMHPAEAYHGDLGMITSEDAIILISYSGETDEIVRLIPSLQHFNIPRIALVGNPNSTLARHANATINIAVEREICPHNLAPTTSTLTTLAAGDAMAVILMQQRGFQPADFARFHPGGSLGRRLLTRVADAMHRGTLPLVSPTATMREVLLAMTQGRLGLALITDSDGNLEGIITDGDLRRAMLREPALLDQPVVRFMSRAPVTISADAMLVEAEQLMRERKIKAVVAVDAQQRVCGIVEIFD